MKIFRWLARAFMARIGWVLAGVVLLALGIDAHAASFPDIYPCEAGQVKKWKLTGVNSSGDLNAACTVGVTYATDPLQCYKASYTGGTPPANYVATLLGTVVNTSTASNFRWRLQGQYLIDYANATPDATNSANQHTYTRECVAAACTEEANGILDLPDPLNTPSGTSLCVNNCQVTAFTGLQVTTKESSTGLIAFGSVGATPQTCTTANTPEPDRYRTCFSADGKTICAYSETPPLVGDGFIDNADPEPDTESAATDEDIAEQEDKCSNLPSGGMICEQGAPGTPDNGIPGQAATPDAVVQCNGDFCGGNQYNYYDSTTVNDSTNQGEGDPDGEGEDSSGECEPGDTTCEEGGRGDGRVTGKGGTAKTFGASAGEFYNRTRNAPILAAVTSIGTSLPSGSCPPISFPLLGEDIGTTVHCDVAVEFAPLGFVFLAMWALAGVVIVLRA